MVLVQSCMATNGFVLFYRAPQYLLVVFYVPFQNYIIYSGYLPHLDKAMLVVYGLTSYIVTISMNSRDKSRRLLVVSRNDNLTPSAPHCQEQDCVACPDGNRWLRILFRDLGTFERCALNSNSISHFILNTPNESWGNVEL